MSEDAQHEPEATSKGREPRAQTPRTDPYAGPAAGKEAVLTSLRYVKQQTGAVRGTRLLLQVNQPGGFDCPGCAWPEPHERAIAELCENGARAVAHEATRRRVDALFFEEHTIPKLKQRSDLWLEAQGRLTEPMVKRPQSDRYEPISWEGAFALIADKLRSLADPNEAAFYTSGRTSNEAAFLYQLFVRQYGTNNLPDCSNLCHESSGVGLKQTLGVEKGTVSLEDFEHADLILVMGQNPGTNHPRMLTTLEAQKRRGAKIISINPLKERGLERFAHPQTARGLLGGGTEMSDRYVQVKIGGDIALLKGVMKLVLAAEDERPGQVLDHDFIQEHTQGFADFKRELERVRWDDLLEESGVSRAEMQAVADAFVEARSVIVCWAMGLTQHKFGVANVREIVNLLLMRGHVGRKGAGVCPVRGHSNVQGDRTMGITERPRERFLERLSQTFHFTAPRAHGYDVWQTLRAMGEGKVRVFFALGGNFAAATPDTDDTRRALARCELTVQVSTKLNRSHLETGHTALILPCLGRTERDVQGGAEQLVTVEDSMGVVHASRGRLAPASEQLRSEPYIICQLAKATLKERSTVDWDALSQRYDEVRELIAEVIPGFANMNERVRHRDGFVLENAAKARAFETSSGKAEFTCNELPRLSLATGQYLLMTIRAHDQFNTSLYGPDDRYRGVYGQRRVVLMNPDDMAQEGYLEGQRVRVTSWFGREQRHADGFVVLPYEIPRRCLASYFPEANVLVPRDSVADESHTPTSKSVVVTLAPSPLGEGRG